VRRHRHGAGGDLAGAARLFVSALASGRGQKPALLGLVGTKQSGLRPFHLQKVTGWDTTCDRGGALLLLFAQIDLGQCTNATFYQRDNSKERRRI
jgi:hypothetical protein